jgi:ABC-type multidrug transport system fused ATPase/permease subunit
LDEATSSLDSVSEIEVQKGLELLMKGRTTFVIAHRLSTVQKASRICVVKEGQIVQSGRHEQLISEPGEYSRLFALQQTGSQPSHRQPLV